MENWRKRSFLRLFWKLQKGDRLYGILEVLVLAVMGTVLALFLLYRRLGMQYAGADGDLGSVLSFCERALQIFLVCSVGITALTLQSLQKFRAERNKKRVQLLRQLGLTGRWKLAYDGLETLFAVLFCAPLIVIAEWFLYRRTAIPLVGTDGAVSAPELVLVTAVVLLLLAAFSFASRRASAAAMAVSYAVILLLAVKQAAVVLGATVFLLILLLCSYALSAAGLSVSARAFGRRKGRLFFRTGGILGKQNRFLIALLTGCLLLFYFLSSLDWGMENFLEQSWLSQWDVNVVLQTEYEQTESAENWLSQQGVSYQKLYISNAEPFTHGMTLAVSGADETSAYYVKAGHVRAAEELRYLWDAQTLDTVTLHDTAFTMDAPEQHGAFAPVEYSCIVNFADAKDWLGTEFSTQFAVKADRALVGKLAQWADENHAELITAPVYVAFAKQEYASYLRMLWTILGLLAASLVLFVFASVLAGTAGRKKEFQVYRGCGVGWRRIRRLALLQYLYSALLGSLLAAVLYALAFNFLRVCFFGGSTVYFTDLR